MHPEFTLTSHTLHTPAIKPRRQLLVLSPWSPYPHDNGSRQRAFFLLRELSKVYEIHLVCGLQSDSPDEIPPPLAALCDHVVCVPWRWHDRRQARSLSGILSPVPRAIRETPNTVLTGTIHDAICRARPDAILALELGMDSYLPDEAFHLPVILDQVEISGWENAGRGAGSDVREHLVRRLTYQKAMRYWPSRLRRYAALTVVSEAEASALRRLLQPGDLYPSVTIVPNGVDADYVAPGRSVNASPGRILFNGSLKYGPNSEAVRWFARDILPRVIAQMPSAHLVVTGRYGPEAAEFAGNRAVQLTGFLPDMRSTLETAVVCIAPLLAGGGTRLKILEAWAAGVPVVSTSIGAAGLQGRDEEHLLLRDDPEGFANAVVSLLTDQARADGLARRARQLVETRYDWPIVAAPLIDLLDRVMASRSAAVSHSAGSL